MLKVSLISLFPHLETTIYFKSPPPPSNMLPVRTPKSNNELKELLEKEAYPTFFEIEERKIHHNFLRASIKKACLISGIEFLTGCYSNDASLEEKNSFDGVHISCGEWAIKNSSQIFQEI